MTRQGAISRQQAAVQSAVSSQQAASSKQQSASTKQQGGNQQSAISRQQSAGSKQQAATSNQQARWHKPNSNRHDRKRHLQTDTITKGTMAQTKQQQTCSQMTDNPHTCKHPRSQRALERGDINPLLSPAKNQKISAQLMKRRLGGRGRNMSRTRTPPLCSGMCYADGAGAPLPHRAGAEVSASQLILIMATTA